MKIDTSTTAGKIAVMQAYENGEAVQFYDGSDWKPLIQNANPSWNWFDCLYRIKPQTAEEAAKEYLIDNYGCLNTYQHRIGVTEDFIAGAKWQKEQDQ